MALRLATQACNAAVRSRFAGHPRCPRGFTSASPPPPHPTTPSSSSSCIASTTAEAPSLVPPPPSVPPPGSRSGRSSSSTPASPTFIANSPALKLSKRLADLARRDQAAAAEKDEALQICIAIGRRLKSELSTFRAADVLQLLTSACKLEQRHVPMLDAIAAHVLRGMVAYPLFALCNVANNLARLGHRNRQLMDALADFLAEPSRAGQLSPVDIASLVFAYAQLSHHPRSSLLEACAERLKGCRLEIGGPNAAIILNSYSKLGECNPVLFGMLSRSVIQTKPESFEVHHISLIMNSYAKCQVRKPQMMHVLSDYLTRRVSELSPQNVSNVVHAFARLDCYNHELFHALVHRVSTEDLAAYKLFELAVLSHNFAKLRAGGQGLYSAMFGELAARPAEVWEPKAVAQVLDAMRRRQAFCHEKLLALLFRRFFNCLEDYAVHPLTQASWCLVELDTLDLAAELPQELDEGMHQGDLAARKAMTRVLERLEEFNKQQPFTPTQRCHVQQLIRAYHYRHELDYGLQPQNVKSFCKSQFDVSTSVVSAVAYA